MTISGIVSLLIISNHCWEINN